MRQKSYEGHQRLPKPGFVRASETTIPKLTTRSVRPSSESTQGANVRVFADRGTDAGELGEIEDIFVPVFPVIEDLVIHFADDRPNRILEFVIQK
jgi:hypothetical protein